MSRFKENKEKGTCCTSPMGCTYVKQCMTKRHAEMVELFNETLFTNTPKHKFKTIKTKQKSNVEIFLNRRIPELNVEICFKYS